MKRLRTTSALAAALLSAAALAVAPTAAASPGAHGHHGKHGHHDHHGKHHHDRDHRPGHGKHDPRHHQKHDSCTRSGALFCEDFQRLPVGATSGRGWDASTSNGTVTVEQGRHGDKVAHVHTEGNGMAFLTVEEFDAPDNTFYGRFRVLVDEFPTAPDWAHFTLVEATGSGSAEIVRPFGGQFAPTVGPDATFYGVGADGGPTGDWTNWRESAPTVAGTWQCVEFAWDGENDAIDVWLDGVAQPDMAVSRTNHGGNQVDFVLPDVDTIKIGWQLYQPSTDSFDTYLDDITFSTQRVGC